MSNYTVYYEYVGMRGFRIIGSLLGEHPEIGELGCQQIEADSHEDAKIQMRTRLIWQEGEPVDQEYQYPPIS